MSTHTEIIKEKLHHFIDVIEEKKLQAIYTLFENEIIDLEEYNIDIEEAEKEIENGNYVTHTDLLSEIKSWKKKAV